MGMLQPSQVRTHKTLAVFMSLYCRTIRHGCRSGRWIDGCNLGLTVGTQARVRR